MAVFPANAGIHSKRTNAQWLSLHQKAKPIQWIPACAGKTEESPFMATHLTAYGRLPRERGDPLEAYERSMAFPASKSQADSMDSRLRGKDGGRSGSNFSNVPKRKNSSPTSPKTSHEVATQPLPAAQPPDPITKPNARNPPRLHNALKNVTIFGQHHIPKKA